MDHLRTKRYREPASAQVPALRAYRLRGRESGLVDAWVQHESAPTAPTTAVRQGSAAVAGSASPAPGNQAQQVQGQLPFAISELDQRPVPANVAIGAGPAGHRQLLRGRARNGSGLDGNGASWQPEYAGAVGQ